MMQLTIKKFLLYTSFVNLVGLSCHVLASNIDHSQIIFDIHENNHLNLTNVRNMIQGKMDVLRIRLRDVDNGLIEVVQTLENRLNAELLLLTEQLNQADLQIEQLQNNIQQLQQENRNFQQRVDRHIDDNALRERQMVQNRIGLSSASIAASIMMFAYSISSSEVLPFV